LNNLDGQPVRLVLRGDVGCSGFGTARAKLDWAPIIRLDRGAKVHRTWPAIDPMFASAAHLYGRRSWEVLSGNGNDGAASLRLIHNQGRLALAQDPTEAPAPQMPAAAIADDTPQLLARDGNCASGGGVLCGPVACLLPLSPLSTALGMLGVP
jgi:CheB methylesterase